MNQQQPENIIELKRTDITKNYARGILLFGDQYCYTLEANENQRIKKGTYRISLQTEGRWFGDFNKDPELKRGVPVLHVPDRNGILFHVGNHPTDSKGCILLGMDYRRGFVLRSRVACKKFFLWLYDNVNNTFVKVSEG